MNEWMNEWGFRPPSCTCRLNWARTTFRGWWDDTAHQTKDSKFQPWWSEAELAISRSRSPLPKYWIFTSERIRNILFLWNLKARVGFEPAISDFPSRQFKHCTMPWPLPYRISKSTRFTIGKLCLIIYTADIWILRNMYNFNVTQT